MLTIIRATIKIALFSTYASKFGVWKWVFGWFHCIRCCNLYLLKIIFNHCILHHKFSKKKTKNKVFNMIGLSEVRLIYGSHKLQIVVTRKGFCLWKAKKMKRKCGDLQYVYPTKPKLQPQHLFCYKSSFFFHQMIYTFYSQDKHKTQ